MDFRKMPLLMKEQKENGKKDQYIEITNVLTQAAEAVATKEEKLELLNALIGTLESMDFQIYELYRALSDCLKKIVKELVASYGDLSEKEKTIISDVVKKACALHILLAEKYEAYMM